MAALTRSHTFTLPLLVLPLLAPLSTGCYLLQQARGQLQILTNRSSIAGMLERGRLDPERARKLRLIGEAKEFGERQVGLTPSGNYTTYYETGGRPVSYVVSACRRDRFEPRVWSFPVVGSLPYKGFFHLQDAVDEARELRREGYDATVRGVSAYSTLGWFDDPVYTGMLRMDDVDLVALILHELTHGTVFAEGKGDWNEGMATFVGQEAAAQFFRLRNGPDSREAGVGAERLAEEETVDAFVRRAHARFQRLYGEGRPLEEVLALRERLWAEQREEFAGLRRSLKGRSGEGLFAGRACNADLVARLRYGRYDVFRKVFAASGGDWPAFFARMREAAAQPDPYQALEAQEPK